MSDDPDADAIGGERYIATHDTAQAGTPNSPHGHKMTCPKHGEVDTITISGQTMCAVCAAEGADPNMPATDPALESGTDSGGEDGGTSQ